MHSPGTNGEGEIRGQPANPGSPGKMAVKTECVCVCFVGEGIHHVSLSRRFNGHLRYPSSTVLKSCSNSPPERFL